MAVYDVQIASVDIGLLLFGGRHQRAAVAGACSGADRRARRAAAVAGDVVAARVQARGRAILGAWYHLRLRLRCRPLASPSVSFIVANDVVRRPHVLQPAADARHLPAHPQGLLDQRLHLSSSPKCWSSSGAWSVAIARLLPGRPGQPIRMIATLYTDVVPRPRPPSSAIYPGRLRPAAGRHPPIAKDLPPPMLAVIALTLTYGAYVAEVYRAGIESIHWSQTAAARSLGLSYLQTLRFVVVPQAVRRIIPPLLNDFIGAAEGYGAGQRHRRHRCVQPGRRSSPATISTCRR